MICKSVTELIGKTPLLELTRFAGGLPGRVAAKLELFNPAGSGKDRVALNMIDDAEKAGLLKPGAVIIEPTSGNTGIGLASVAASRGYRAILTMPSTMSVERRRLLAAYGAEIVLVEGGMPGAIAKAKELAESMENVFLPGQFINPANPEAHYKTTAPEIWEQSGGDVDIFVAGVGTGGTITGVGKYLREKKTSVSIVAVEPDTSAVLSGEPAGKHGLQGIGAGFVPEVLNTTIYDEIIKVTDEEAFAAAKELAHKEGVLVGISSGAAAFAARKLAERPESAGKLIVALLMDTGERYLSTGIYD